MPEKKHNPIFLTLVLLLTVVVILAFVVSLAMVLLTIPLQWTIFLGTGGIIVAVLMS